MIVSVIPGDYGITEPIQVRRGLVLEVDSVLTGWAEKSIQLARPNWSKATFRLQNFQLLNFVQKVHE